MLLASLLVPSRTILSLPFGTSLGSMIWPSESTSWQNPGQHLDSCGSLTLSGASLESAGLQKQSCAAPLDTGRCLFSCLRILPQQASAFIPPMNRDELSTYDCIQEFYQAATSRLRRPTKNRASCPSRGSWDWITSLTASFFWALLSTRGFEKLCFKVMDVV